MSKSEGNEWYWWLVLILMVLGVLWIFGVFGGGDDYTNYNSCVESCVSDINHCVFFDIVYDNQREAWVKWNDYDVCSLELESCISDCELDG